MPLQAKYCRYCQTIHEPKSSCEVAPGQTLADLETLNDAGFAMTEKIRDDGILLRISEAPGPVPVPKFVAVGCAVMDRSECVARAKSKTFAKRIANALNNHKVNSEGC